MENQKAQGKNFKETQARFKAMEARARLSEKKIVKCNREGLSQRLIEIRKTKNLDQFALAKKIGVTRETISKYENGKSTPDFERMCEYIEIGGVSPNYFFGYGDSDIYDLEIAQFIGNLSIEKKEAILHVLRFM